MNRRIATAVVAAGCVLSTATGCSVASNFTSNEDKFCGRLRTEFRLEDLATAIERRDQRRITESLVSLRTLQDVAPAEIHDDFRALVDAASEAVRLVTKAPGADGERLPVDVDRLNQQLAGIAGPAQEIASYADKSCGLKLNP